MAFWPHRKHFEEKPVEPEWKQNRRYSLVGPVPGGDDWWEINDMEKMYALITVQGSFPNAEEVIRFAWAKIKD